jgi:hypothetical protein
MWSSFWSTSSEDISIKSSKIQSKIGGRQSVVDEFRGSSRSLLQDIGEFCHVNSSQSLANSSKCLTNRTCRSTLKLIPKSTSIQENSFLFAYQSIPPLQSSSKRHFYAFPPQNCSNRTKNPQPKHNICRSPALVAFNFMLWSCGLWQTVTVIQQEINANAEIHVNDVSCCRPSSSINVLLNHKKTHDSNKSLFDDRDLNLL